MIPRELLPPAPTNPVDCLVLQVGLRPQTGIWTLMRELLAWQNQRAGVLAVGGYLGDQEWVASYGSQLGQLGIPFLFENIPDIWRWGVERHLRQVFRSPVNRWIAALYHKYRPRRIAVHFHDAWLSGGFLPVRAPENCDLVALATFNGISSHELFRSSKIKSALHRFLAQRLVKYGCRLVSVDRCNLTYAQEFFGLDPKSFAIIPNSVRDLGLPGCPCLRGAREFIVGHVGSVTESKGWRILAEAVLSLRKRGLPVRLVVAGDGEQLPELTELSRNNPDAISALGRVPHAGKDVIPQLDALGLISRWEGQPLCILEALSCGVPVVATDVGGIMETIVDGESGFIVSRSAEQTAERIAQWVESPALHAKMSDAARSTFMGRFHIDRVGAAYAKLYAE
jgi:glycosyltransferase involved in cell wall biosynthesis